MMMLLGMYLLVGAGHAVVLVRRKKNWRDVPLVLITWPLYASLFVGSPRPPTPSHSPNDDSVNDDAFKETLAQTRAVLEMHPLADRRSSELLVTWLHQAVDKVRKSDTLLASPMYDEAEARTRLERVMRGGGEGYALTLARSHLQNIVRLQALNSRYRQLIDDIGQLVVQLRVQTEVAQLCDDTGLDSQRLLTELVSRIEGLDAVMNQADAPWSDPSPEHVHA